MTIKKETYVTIKKETYVTIGSHTKLKLHILHIEGISALYTLSKKYIYNFCSWIELLRYSQNHECGQYMLHN